ILKKVLSKKPSKKGRASGRTFNTKNIDPTIINGIAEIPALIIARTNLQEAIFPMGPIMYFSINIHILFSLSSTITRHLFSLYINRFLVLFYTLVLSSSIVFDFIQTFQYHITEKYTYKKNKRN